MISSSLCPTCNQVVTPIKRMITVVQLRDNSEEHQGRAFHEVSEVLMKQSVDALASVPDPDRPALFAETYFKPQTLKGKCMYESYNDDARANLTVLEVRAPDFAGAMKANSLELATQFFTKDWAPHKYPEVESKSESIPVA